MANQNSIQVLQKNAVRKICFKKCKEQVSGDFKIFGILKFHDFIKLQNCLFICQLEQDEQVSKSFPALKHCGENSLTLTHMVRSLLYDCIADWNSFRKTLKHLPLSECSRFKFKKLLKQLFLNKY